MQTDIKQFGQLFTKFRLKAEFLTLSEFGKALADEGLLYEDSIFSRWQKGNRVPRDRHVLLTIIKVFIKRRGITTPSEANLLLEAAIHGYLTKSEETELFGSVLTSEMVTPTDPFISSVPSVQLSKDEFNTELSTIVNSNEKLASIEKQVNLFYEVIYEGYASIAYERLQKLLEIMQLLRLDSTQEGKNLVSKIHLVRARAMSEIYGEASEYDKAIQEVNTMLTYAKDNNTTGIGDLYFMRSSLERKRALIASSAQISRDTLVEALHTTEKALTLIPKDDTKIRIIAYNEIAFFALALRDKETYERAMFQAFSLLDELPLELRFLKALVWDAKARGNIRFSSDIETALENSKIAKGFTQARYQMVNLNIQSTQLQALELSKDSGHKHYADKLRELLRMETIVLGNPYQRMRFEKKKFLGL